LRAKDEVELTPEVIAAVQRRLGQANVAKRWAKPGAREAQSRRMKQLWRDMKEAQAAKKKGAPR
jgi:hypothetical protein